MSEEAKEYKEYSSVLIMICDSNQENEGIKILLGEGAHLIFVKEKKYNTKNIRSNMDFPYVNKELLKKKGETWKIETKASFIKFRGSFFIFFLLMHFPMFRHQHIQVLPL